MRDFIVKQDQRETVAMETRDTEVRGNRISTLGFARLRKSLYSHGIIMVH